MHHCCWRGTTKVSYSRVCCTAVQPRLPNIYFYPTDKHSDTIEKNSLNEDVLFKNYKESFLQWLQVDFQIYLHGLDGLINFQESLRFGQNHISSTAGVQQGDHLGPLLFSLSIWYLDDGTFLGREILFPIF